MAYDKDKRNLRQRCSRFLKKNGIGKTSEFYSLELPSNTARRLLGVEWRDTAMVVPLGILPQEAVIALQGLSLLAMSVIPSAGNLIQGLRGYAEAEASYAFAADMLYHFGMARGWFAYRLPRTVPNGQPVSINGDSLLELLRMYKTADTAEIAEQYMYLR